MIKSLETALPVANAAKGFRFFEDVYESSVPKMAFAEVSGLRFLYPSESAFLGAAGLGSHSAIPWQKEDLQTAREALQHLEYLHSEDWSILKKRLGGLILLDLREEYLGVEGKVTSISLPGLPYVSLISRKAYIHAPPSLLFEYPSAIIFAENMIHEAAHQLLNQNLIEYDLFVDGYDAGTGGKIDIPWRTKAFHPRDRLWATDRCLHAALVYSVVARFRARVLSSGLLENPYTLKDVSEARENGLYLARKIRDYRSELSVRGLKVTAEILEVLNAC